MECKNFFKRPSDVERQNLRREEKAMAAKKPVKKVARKVVKKRVKEGDVYKCGVCGLAVTVDEVCGCVDACDIICCERPMKSKKRA